MDYSSCEKGRITFLRTEDIYPSLEEAKLAISRYAEANYLLDGEPIIARYYDDDGLICVILGICTVTEHSGRCVSAEQLSYITNQDILSKLAAVAYSGEYKDLLNKPEIYGTDGIVVEKNEDDDVTTWTISADSNVLATVQALTAHTSDSVIHVTQQDKDEWSGKSVVSVSNTGSSTNEISYITINGVQSKIKGSDLVVNDGKLTIKKNDNDTGSEFTANQASDVTVNLGLATVATSGNYNDLSSVPTNVSHFTNDAGYLVSSDINEKADKVLNATNGNLAGLDTNGNLTDSGIVGTDVATAVRDMHTHSNKDVLDATTASFTDSNYVHTDNNYTTTEKDKLSGIEEGAEVNVQSDWNVTDTSSDAYIKNKPEIPTALSDLSDDVNHRLVTDTDIQNWDGKYTKPNGGIPKTDLDTNVQSSLDKADTSIQPSDISDMQVKSNLRTSFQTTPDNTHYPSEKLVKDSLDTKEPTLATQTAYTQKGTSTKVPQITTNTKGQVTGITEVDISFPSGSGSVTGDTTTFVKSVTLSGHTLTGQTQAADSQITDAASGIPTTAAVREFVNSSVSNMAANYITKNANGDAFDSNSELIGASTYYSGGTVFTPTKNDYAIVLKDETQAEEISGYSSFTDDDEYIGFYILVGSTYTLVTDSNVSSLGIVAGTTKAYELPTTRYINSSTTTTPSWSFQYIINDTGLTAAQIAAINSGINATKVGNYETHISDTTIHVTSSDKTNWNAKLDPVTAVTHDSTKNYIKQVTQSTDGQVSIVEGVLDYNDLANVPTIPSAPGTLVTNATTGQTASSGESMSGTITLHKVSKTGSYNDLLNKPTIPTVPTDVSAFNNDAGYITLGDVPAQVNADWNSNSGVSQILNKPTIPSAPGTLDTTATTSQITSASEALSGNVVLHKISKTGSYTDLLDKPNIPTSAILYTAQTLTPEEQAQARSNIGAGSSGFSGDYNDLTNKPDLKPVATSGSYNDLTNKPTIPSAPGTLNTTATTAQSTSSNEALSGNVTLHKISKTGTYSDLIGTPNLATVATSGSYNDLSNKPSIPSAPGTLNTTATTAQSTSASEALSGPVTLHKIAKTGTYSDLIGLPTIPDAVSGTNDGTNWTSITIGSDNYGIPSGGGGGDTVTGKTVTLGTTGVAVMQVNGVDEGSVSLPSGSTSGAGIVQLTNSTSSASTTTAATPNSVKSAYDLAAGAIPKSTGSAAGDIIYYTDASTPTRLAKGTAGQVLTMNSGATAPEWQTPSGGGGLTNYNFTHVANTTVTSPFTFACAANQRNSQMITTGANLTLNITCNNGSDNYLWIINSSSSADIDVVIGTVTYNGNTVSASSIYLPSDGISVPKSGLCEIGIIMNTDGCFITTRSDLTPST